MRIALVSLALLAACGPHGGARILHSGTLDEGTAPELLRLAKQRLIGEGVPRDRDKSVELLFEACERDSPRGCYSFMQLDGAGAVRQQFALDVLWRHCRTGDLWSCNTFYERTPNLWPPAELDDLRRACDGGIASACMLVSLKVRRTHYEEAEALQLRACWLGDPDACWYVWPDTADIQQHRIAIFRRACEQGVAAGCAHSGDWPKALRVEMAECGDLNIASCDRLTRMSDRPAFVQAARMICIVDPARCSDLRSIVANDDKVVALDPGVARAACVDRCLGGRDGNRELSGEARVFNCVQGAKLFAAADEGLVPDRRRAAELMEQACARASGGLDPGDAADLAAYCKTHVLPWPAQPRTVGGR